MTEAESKVWKQNQSLFERCRSRSNYLVRNARMLIGEKTMTAKDPRKAAYVMGLIAGVSIIWTANLNGQAIQRLVGTPLPELPQVASPFELRAINDPVTGKGAFVFEGHEIPPVIRAVPGGTIQLEYVNQMSNRSSEVCVDGPCTNMTNLHFHGLHVSPNAPGDDVLGMMAMPGESLHYTVDVPRDQPPGLYWYHTHPHGESYQQDLDGMSGAIVIDGMERYFPEIEKMKEKILILRDAELEPGSSSSRILKRAVQLAPYNCGAATRGKQPFWPDNLIKREIRPVAKTNGIHEKIGWHTSRHSFVTSLKTNGKDVKTVQELLRHANSNSTLDVYTHVVKPFPPRS